MGGRSFANVTSKLDGASNWGLSTGDPLLRRGEQVGVPSPKSLGEAGPRGI